MLNRVVDSKKKYRRNYGRIWGSEEIACIQDFGEEREISVNETDSARRSPRAGAKCQCQLGETQTADAIKKFLDDKQIPLLVENGGTCPVPSQELQDD